MEKEIYWLWLSGIKGFGNLRQRRLLDHWESPEFLFEEDEEHVKQFMGEEKVFSSENFKNFCQSKRELSACFQELEKMKRHGITMLCLSEENYPEKLRELSDAPTVLFQMGRQKAREMLHLAVVGTRRISHYGREVAVHLGKRCAEQGIVLVSGMASGVDGVAQRACLQAGGYSIGVLGSGLGFQFPAVNRDLYLKMEECGILLSEERYDVRPLPQLFPKRNRIISGLADVVVVVEAAEKSGSLITADYALEQGKDIYAVPGRIFDQYSQGCNHLIAQGAYVLEDMDEFFANFTGKKKNLGKKEKNLEENEKRVYEQIGIEPIYIERILEKTNLEQGELQLILLQLELKAEIEQIAAGYYVLRQ